MRSSRFYRCLGRSTGNEWRKLRHFRVTGSETASLFNESPYQSYNQLLNQKLRDKPPTMELRPSLLWGSLMEGPNMHLLCSAFRLKHKNVNLFLESRLEPRLACTIDGLCTPRRLPGGLYPNLSSDPDHAERLAWELECKDTIGLVEMKQTGLPIWNYAMAKGKIHDWTTSVPAHIMHQVQTQMFITNYDWTLVLCRIGADDFRGHVVDKDPKYGHSLLAEVETFFKRLEEKRKAA